jgi:hypothetical protein
MTPMIGFQPDADPNTPGIMTDCFAVVPFESGFRGAASPVAAAVNPLIAPCIGAVVVTSLDGTRRVLAGTTSDLYELTTSTWTSRTRATIYSGGSDTRWSFCQFGNTTIASNLADAMQSSSGVAFADIPTAPKAQIVISATNSFVVAFNTSDPIYGATSDRWWCCAQGDQTNWTPAVTTLATTGRLVAIEGPITAARTLGNYIVAYKDRAIFLGAFVGSPVVWQWELVPGGEAGAIGQESVCDIGGIHFIVGNDNFWLFDGSRPIPIGNGIVRNWFLNNCSPSYRYKTKAVYSKQTNTVRIYFPSNTSTGQCDLCLVYHVLTKQWGIDHQTIEATLSYIKPGVTIDGLVAFGATIKTLPATPMDSQFWLSGGQLPAYFDANHQLSTLTGSCGASSFTTGDVGDDYTVTRIKVGRIRFTQSPTTATANGAFKQNEGDTLITGATNAINDGKFDLRQSGRFHRVVFSMTGDHKETGYDLQLIPAGER